MSNKGRIYPSHPEKDFWTLPYEAPHWYLPKRFRVSELLISDPLGGIDYPGPFDTEVGVFDWPNRIGVWIGEEDLPAFPLYTVNADLVYRPGWAGARPQSFTRLTFAIGVLGFISHGYIENDVIDGHPDFFFGQGPIDYRGGLITGYTYAQATWSAKNW